MAGRTAEPCRVSAEGEVAELLGPLAEVEGPAHDHGERAARRDPGLRARGSQGAGAIAPAAAQSMARTAHAAPGTRPSRACLKRTDGCRAAAGRRRSRTRTPSSRRRCGPWAG